MQANQTTPQTSALAGSVSTIWNWFIQAVGLAAALLVITQTFDLEYSAKEVRTTLHYKGNVLLDLARPHDK